LVTKDRRFDLDQATMPKVTTAVLMAAAALLQGVQLSEGSATGDTEASSTGEMASDFSSRPLFPKMRPMRPLRRMLKVFFPRPAGVRLAGVRSKHREMPTDKEELADLGLKVSTVYKNLQNLVEGEPIAGSDGEPTKADWDSQLSSMEGLMDRMMKMNDCYQISAEDKEPLKMARADVEALKHHEVHLKGHDFIAAAVKRLGDDFAGYVKGGFVDKLQPLIEVRDYLAKVELRMDKFAKDMHEPYPAWADAIAEHTKEIEKYMDEHKHAADSPDMAFIKTAVAAIKKPTLVTPPVMPKDEKPYGVSKLPPPEPLAVSEPVRQLAMFKSQAQQHQEHEQARDAYLEYLKAMQAHYAELSEWAKLRTILEGWAKFDLQMNKYALAKAQPVTIMITDTIAEIKKKNSHCAKPALGGPDGEGAEALDGEGAATPDGEVAMADQEGAAEPARSAALQEGGAEPAQPTGPEVEEEEG